MDISDYSLPLIFIAKSYRYLRGHRNRPSAWPACRSAEAGKHFNN